MRIISLLLVLAWALPVVAQGSNVPLNNPGFEEPYKPVYSSSDAPNQKAVITGQLAEGWGDNSNWADVTLHYERDTTNPHRGASSQKIEVKRVAGGAVQFVQNVPFKKGRVHIFRVWLRGQPGTSVNLSMRQGPAPYKEYANTNAALAAEWQEFRVFGVVTDDTNGFLMIRATAPVTFWVDDASFEDLTEAKSDAPARTGNLITGGSFEVGQGDILPFGWSVRFQGSMANRFADPRPRIDQNSAAQGQKSLRCDILPGDNVAIASPLFNFNYNRPHVLSLWLKAAKANTHIDLSLERLNVRKGVKVGPQWQRVTLPATPTYYPYSMLRISTPSAPEGNTLWIDGVQLEEKTEASLDFIEVAPAEFTMTLPNAGKVVFDGEKANVRVTWAGRVPVGAKLQLSATDLKGKVYAVPAVNLPANGFTLPDFNGRRGLYKLRGEIIDGGRKAISPPVEMVWARLPRPKNIDPAKSFFGTHISLSPYYIQLARVIGHRKVRLHDTSMIGKWAIAEPEPGKWEFHDAGVTAAKNGGLEVLGMLDGAPKWASATPRDEGGYWAIWNIPNAPDSPAKWENYVRSVVSHYKGRIDRWEIWNEPWGKWFLGSGGTPELFADLSKRAYRVAKQANPNSHIIGVDTYRGHESTWTEPVLKNANSDFYDSFSFHDYNDAFYGGPDPMPVTTAKILNDLQNKYGTAKPLWNTEGGIFNVGSFYSPETGGMAASNQPAYAVRYDVTNMAAGVQAYYIYAIHTDPAMIDRETRLTEHDRAIGPILAARAVLASFVDGAGKPVRQKAPDGVDDYLYPNGVRVLWSYNGAPHEVVVPRGMRALDVWGNALPNKGKVTVGPEPVYFIKPSPDRFGDRMMFLDFAFMHATR